jgi:hypothetical protein
MSKNNSSSSRDFRWSSAVKVQRPDTGEVYGGYVLGKGKDGRWSVLVDTHHKGRPPRPHEGHRDGFYVIEIEAPNDKAGRPKETRP